MSGSDEFLYFVSQGVAFVGGVAIVAVVMTILVQICVGWVVILPGWGRRSACRTSSSMRDRGALRGA